jgi:hypothetical protein
MGGRISGLGADKEVWKMKRASVIGLMVFMAMAVAGCRSTGSGSGSPKSGDSDFKTYADRKPMGDVVKITSSKEHPATMNMSGGTITVSTMVPPIEPPNARKYAMYESVAGKVCNLLTFGIFGWFAHAMVQDSGGTTNITNSNAAPAAP